MKEIYSFEEYVKAEYIKNKYTGEILKKEFKKKFNNNLKDQFIAFNMISLTKINDIYFSDNITHVKIKENKIPFSFIYQIELWENESFNEFCKNQLVGTYILLNKNDLDYYFNFIKSKYDITIEKIIKKKVGTNMKKDFTLKEFIEANYIKDNNTEKIYKKVMKSNYENSSSICYNREYFIIDIDQMNKDLFESEDIKDVIVSKTNYHKYIMDILSIKGNEKSEELNKYSIVDVDELDFIISTEIIERVKITKQKKKEIIKKEYIFE